MFKLLRNMGPRQPVVYRRSPEVRIRWATAEDATRIDVLAQLDEAPVPPAPVLLGFVGEELWAAASLSNGDVIAEPFRPSAEVASLVLQRGRQLTAVGRSAPGAAGRGRVRRFVAASDSRLPVSHRAS